MRIKILDQEPYIEVTKLGSISIEFHSWTTVTMLELQELERIFATTILEIEPTIIRYIEVLVITVTMNKPTTDTWKEYLIND